MDPSSLHRPIDDRIVVETPGNAIGFLLATRPPPDVARMSLLAGGGTWASFEYEGEVAHLHAMRLYTGCGVALAPLHPEGLPPLDELDSRIAESLQGGLLGLLRAPVRFRVGPLRFGRFDLRDHLVARFGWVNDPGCWHVNVAAVGPYLVAQIGALHASRRLGSLQRATASTNRVVAAILAYLLGDLPPGSVVLDPLCGAATLLAEVLARSPAAICVGGDRRSGVLGAARANVRAPLVVHDATALPFPAASVHAVVADLPFGNRTGSHRVNVAMYPRFASELARVLVPGGRAALLTAEAAHARRAPDEDRGGRRACDRRRGPQAVRVRPAQALNMPALDARTESWILRVTKGSRITSATRLYPGATALVHGIRVSAPGRRARFVLKRPYEAVFTGSTSEESRNEAVALRAARRSALPAPELVALDHDGSRSGKPGVLMTWMPGRVELGEGALRPRVRRLARVLAQVHSVPARGVAAKKTWAIRRRVSPPSWSRRRGAWSLALAHLRSPAPACTERVFLHGDYHPGNMLWSDGRLSGLIDWSGGRRGPRHLDVAHCRSNLMLLLGTEAADEFLLEYERRIGRELEHQTWFDVRDALIFTPEPFDVWDWAGAGRPDLTRKIMRRRLDDYIASLARRI
jgi:aminoglycoside phosphotransferase (APT) family kinase protein